MWEASHLYIGIYPRFSPTAATALYFRLCFFCFFCAAKVGGEGSVLAAEATRAGNEFKDSRGGGVFVVDHVSAQVAGEVRGAGFGSGARVVVTVGLAWLGFGLA